DASTELTSKGEGSVTSTCPLWSPLMPTFTALTSTVKLWPDRALSGALNRTLATTPGAVVVLLSSQATRASEPTRTALARPSRRRRGKGTFMGPSVVDTLHGRRDEIPWVQGRCHGASRPARAAAGPPPQGEKAAVSPVLAKTPDGLM